MGLDIYAGTLTRYYSRNWLTSVQKWGLENGFQVNIVRPEGQENTASPEVIYEGVTQWRDNIIKGLGAELSEAPLWNEDYDTTPYYTDKPDWDAVDALLLYIAAKRLGKEAPPTVIKNFDVWEHPICKEYMSSKTEQTSLFDGGGWWVPVREPFLFNYVLPTGQESPLATAGLLKKELEYINSLEWNADRETIIGWRDSEGYPTDATYRDGKIDHIAKHEEFDTVSLAKFAFSILWQAAEFSLENGTVIIYDF